MKVKSNSNDATTIDEGISETSRKAVGRYCVIWYYTVNTSVM
jgi:hypothetical protein